MSRHHPQHPHNLFRNYRSRHQLCIIPTKTASTLQLHPIFPHPLGHDSRHGHQSIENRQRKRGDGCREHEAEAEITWRERGGKVPGPSIAYLNFTCGLWVSLLQSLDSFETGPHERNK